MKQYWTVRDLAARWKCHPTTVYDWRKEGKIPYTEIGGKILFDEAEIQKLEENGSFSPVPLQTIFPADVISLAAYDKLHLKGVSKVGVTTRYAYHGLGIVVERKTKKGGLKFGIDYKLKGKRRVRKALPLARSRAEAVKVLTNELADAFREAHGFKRETPELTFKEMADKYLENSKQRRKRSWRSFDQPILKTLCTTFGQLRLSEVTPEKIEDYLTALLKAGLKKNSANRHHACGSSLYTKANDWGYCSVNPFKKVKKFSEVGMARQRILTEAEEERLLRALPDYMRNIVCAALLSGARRGELLPLKWADVHFNEGFIHVAMSKSGKPRDIEINSELMAMLKSLQAKAVTEYVFPNPKTGLPYADGRKAFQKACGTAGIISLRFHDLRHSYATRLRQAGADIVTIMNLLGHSSLAMTQLYTHPQAEEKRRAVEMLCKNPAKNPDENELPSQTRVQSAVPVPATNLESVS